jgi:hypothetical protein
MVWVDPPFQAKGATPGSVLGSEWLAVVKPHEDPESVL